MSSSMLRLAYGPVLLAMLFSHGMLLAQPQEERWELLGNTPENLAAIEEIERTFFANPTGLFFTMNQSNRDRMELFFKAGLDVNAKVRAEREGEAPYTLSVLQMYLESYGSCEYEDTLAFLEMLLKRGADPNPVNPNTGSTPLIDVATYACAPHTRLLIKYGADPNVADNRGELPLDRALTYARTDQVKALIEGGAKLKPSLDELIKRTYGEGRTEIRKYLKSLKPDTPKPVVRRNPKPKAEPKRPNTLPATLKAWDLKVTQELLTGGAPANQPVGDIPPLIYITRECYDKKKEGHADFIKVLTAKGADINARAKITEETALAMAVQRCSVDVVEALLAAGSDPNVVYVGGQNPLMRAVMMGNVPIVEALLDAGAKPDKQTKFMARSNPEIKKLLKKKRR